MGKRIAFFIAVWRLHASGKKNFKHHFLNVSILMTVGRIITKIYIYLYIFILGFFRKPEKLGSNTGSK